MKKGCWREDLNLLEENLVKRQTASPNKERALSSFSSPGFSSRLEFQHPHVEFRSELGNRGGGRGYFATNDIFAGELLLCEKPAAEIPTAAVWKNRDPSERCLLHLAHNSIDTLETSQAFLRNLELLHPRTLEEVAQDRVQALQRDYAPLLQDMIASPLGRQLGLTEELYLIRALCALHFNGFATGVYLYLAMVNHSCCPNSVKWGARDGFTHSEVRAARSISKGEEITFSYLVPVLRSKGARQRSLQGQFGFTCSCLLCTSPSFGGSEVHEDELEHMLEEVEKRDLVLHQPDVVFKSVNRARNEARLKGNLDPRNLALAHADMVIVECCLSLLEDSVSPSQEMQFYVLTLLTKAFSIRRTQMAVFQQFGHLSHQVMKETWSESETTLQHIASGIGYFSASSKGLPILLSFMSDDGRQLFTNKQEAVQCQTQCFRASKAIAALYT